MKEREGGGSVEEREGRKEGVCDALEERGGETNERTIMRRERTQNYSENC